MRAALKARGPVTVTAPNGARLELTDPDASVEALARRVLTPTAQQFLLRDLCNNNVRKALAAFAYFLRYRELRFELINPVKQTQIDTSQERLWLGHLLVGLMIGDREYYVDRNNGSPITNMYYVERDGTADYCIMYRIICLVEWADRYVEVSELIRWLYNFGYRYDAIRAALDKLLQRGLIYSPESERLPGARNVKISSAGRLYLNNLLLDGEYLINAVYDVPLPHAAWRDDVRTRAYFECSLSSIDELITAVYTQEFAELQVLVAQAGNIAALGSVVHCGLLTRRLLRASRRLIGDAHYTKYGKSSRSGGAICGTL